MQSTKRFNKNEGREQTECGQQCVRPTVHHFDVLFFLGQIARHFEVMRNHRQCLLREGLYVRVFAVLRFVGKQFLRRCMVLHTGIRDVLAIEAGARHAF